MEKRRVDYSYKSYVLKEHSELIHDIKKARMLDYANKVFNEEGVITYSFTHNDGKTSIDVLNNALDKGLNNEYFEALKIIHADYTRRTRLHKRISAILESGDSVFLTLTFRDDVFQNTTLQERRVAVSRYLKKYNALYVANIDYGKEKDREHYHAVLGVGKINHKEWYENYGCIKAKKIRKTDLERSKSQLSKYITKLTNHAIKDTTRRSALIYSR